MKDYQITLNLSQSELEELKLDLYQRLTSGSLSPTYGVDWISTQVVRESMRQDKPILRMPANLDTVLQEVLANA